MWILQLNDMRSSKFEDVQPVLCAKTRERLVEVIKSEKVKPYLTGRWSKTFRKDGPLEWCNGPRDIGRPHFVKIKEV